MQIANGLDYAHGKGIFHRDIKPSNILRVGDGRTVKIADFGIAHMESLAAADQTRAGTVIGTPHYMSPEQAMGTRVDGRSDLFSVGVVLYQLLTGVRPFEADSMVTLVYRIAKEEPKPVGDLRKDVPPALRRIVDRCLQKAPENRFQTGRELADALAKVWRELDAEADRDGKPRRLPLKVKLALGMAARGRAHHGGHLGVRHASPVPDDAQAGGGAGRVAHQADRCRERRPRACPRTGSASTCSCRT